jgi:hypothetical protein
MKEQAGILTIPRVYLFTGNTTLMLKLARIITQHPLQNVTMSLRQVGEMKVSRGMVVLLTTVFLVFG